MLIHRAFLVSLVSQEDCSACFGLQRHTHLRVNSTQTGLIFDPNNYSSLPEALNKLILVNNAVKTTTVSIYFVRAPDSMGYWILLLWQHITRASPRVESLRKRSIPSGLNTCYRFPFILRCPARHHLLFV